MRALGFWLVAMHWGALPLRGQALDTADVHVTLDTALALARKAAVSAFPELSQYLLYSVTPRVLKGDSGGLHWQVRWQERAFPHRRWLVIRVYMSDGHTRSERLIEGQGASPGELSGADERSVREALRAIDDCYHWAGEVGDQSEERNREIVEGIDRDCPIAQQKAEKAYRLHPENGVLAAGILQLIDIDRYQATDIEKATICGTAVAKFRDDYSKSRSEDAVFRAICPAQASNLYGR